MRIYNNLQDVLDNENDLNWQGTLFVNQNSWAKEPTNARFIYLEGDDELADDIVDEETMLPRLAEENNVKQFLDVEVFTSVTLTQRELKPDSDLNDFIHALKYYLEYDTFYWPKK